MLFYAISGDVDSSTITRLFFVASRRAAIALGRAPFFSSTACFFVFLSFARPLAFPFSFAVLSLPYRPSRSFSFGSAPVALPLLLSAGNRRSSLVGEHSRDSFVEMERFVGALDS